MALEVIGAGLGRNATLSMKLALEHLGFGPCYHMLQQFAGSRRHLLLWLEVLDGKPDWDAIFAGYRSTTDYPACTYWRELAAHYPAAKVVLTTRNPDSWFDSISGTIFSEQMGEAMKGSPFETLLYGTAIRHFDGRLRDRAFMTEWYARRNQELFDPSRPSACWCSLRGGLGAALRLPRRSGARRPLSRLTASRN